MQDQNQKPDRYSIVSEYFEPVIGEVADERFDGKPCNDEGNHIADDQQVYFLRWKKWRQRRDSANNRIL